MNILLFDDGWDHEPGTEKDGCSPGATGPSEVDQPATCCQVENIRKALNCMSYERAHLPHGKLEKSCSAAG
jgi:hypothetical protein